METFDVYIYKIENIINHKVYIGITSKTPEERFKQHIKESHYSTFYLHRAFRKWGVENFKLSILHKLTANTKEEQIQLFENRGKQLEIQEISNHKSFGDFGYNLTAGGNGSLGTTKSDETKEKIRKMLSRNELWTKERRQIWRERTNKQMTENVRKQHSERAKEYYKTHNNPMQDKHHSKETKELMSEIKKEQYLSGKWIPPNTGKHLSEETKQKLSESKKSRSTTEYTIKTNGMSITTKYLKDFCRLNEINYKSLKSILYNSKNKTKIDVPIKYKNYTFIRHN